MNISFSVIIKNLCHTQGHKSLLLLFFPSGFIVLVFFSFVLSHFTLCFNMVCTIGQSSFFFFLAYGYAVVPAPFDKNSTSPFSTYLGVCFWNLNFVSLFYLTTFMSIPHDLDCCSWIVGLGSLMCSSDLFFFQKIFYYFRAFAYPYQF